MKEKKVMQHYFWNWLTHNFCHTLERWGRYYRMGSFKIFAEVVRFFFFESKCLLCFFIPQRNQRNLHWLLEFQKQICKLKNPMVIFFFPKSSVWQSHGSQFASELLRAGGYGSTWRSLQYNLHFLVVWFSRVSNRKKITNCVHDFFLLTFAIAPHPVDWLGSRVWSVVVYWKWSMHGLPLL